MQQARWLRTAPLWLSAAWVMSLSTLGFFVVPMLFAQMPLPALAGNMAAKLFSAQTGVSVACALLLVVVLRSDKHAAPAHMAPAVTLLALAGALLALLVEFGVSPRIVARDNLRLWHAVGSAMYFAQWLCALLAFGKLANAAVASQVRDGQP
jgi:hypothetical protein